MPRELATQGNAGLEPSRLYTQNKAFGFCPPAIPRDLIEDKLTAADVKIRQLPYAYMSRRRDPAAYNSTRLRLPRGALCW